MRLDIVTPERRLVSADVISVQIPGADGDLTVMANHAPLITTLRPGVLTVTSEKGSESFAVIGGFAEVNASGASVLAERALPAAELSQDVLDSLVAEAAAAHKAAGAETVDAAAKALADTLAMGAALGLSARVG